MDVDAHLLSNLAAGPLEDYLVAHGETEIERVERLAKHDPSLRDLLAQTWKNSMSDEVVAAGTTCCHIRLGCHG
jgi:hypothetical protein